MSIRRSIAASASKDRLGKLIQERLRPGADRETLDSRIWDLFGENWCVMFTDLSGFSRSVAKFGIIHFFQTIYESERLLIPVTEEQDGILLKTEGDRFLVIFRNVVKAIQCAATMQTTLRGYNENKPDKEKVLLCVGLGYGRVLHIGDSDVYGYGVNAASKLGEDSAKATGIPATGAVARAANHRRGVTFSDIGGEPHGISGAFRIEYH